MSTQLAGTLLAGIPVEERRLELAGVSTSVLEGGDGPPLVLLHGPGASAAHWLRVLPDLVATHHVIAPDLPGLGASEVSGGALVAERVLAWLGELIDSTCPSPPALVGYALGGAIAARFAAAHGDRISHLVLVDALGLTSLDPAPEFGLALHGFLAQPSEQTHDELWRHCARDLPGLRERMDGRWEPFRAANVALARTPSVQVALGALMEQFGGPPIATAELARISAPTSLIWGRYDLATPLEVAVDACAAHLWPLQVIEDCADDPPIERPESFVAALRTAIGTESA